LANYISILTTGQKIIKEKGKRKREKKKGKEKGERISATEKKELILI